MLTKVYIKNFKRFREVEIELGNPVVFVGPNNWGKSSALQALALWHVGIKRWKEKRLGKKSPEKRSGVAINRRDLFVLPVPSANLLWRDLHVRSIERINGKQQTKNIRIEILVEGIDSHSGKSWRCGLEFDYANEESFYCRPLREENGKNPKRMKIPEEATKVEMAFLPPMSGLVANETRLDKGAIQVRIGEGRTAEVLRNLCYQIYETSPEKWEKIRTRIGELFQVELLDPDYIPERGEIEMRYRERGITFDLSSSGRGLQQILLLLAYMYANPGAVLLLDEPDAHLEILRQRQVYHMLSEIAGENQNQVIAATHSEVVLEEAARTGVLVAFVGRPHRIDDRGSQVLKALKTIEFRDYYQAEETGWVLYLEGATDLRILQAFAKRLQHQEAIRTLDCPFVRYVRNEPREVREHFWGLKEAMPDLQGIAIFDRIEQKSIEHLGPEVYMWKKREIENYLCTKETLLAYAEGHPAGAPISEESSLFDSVYTKERKRRRKIMEILIREYEQAFSTLGRPSPWSGDLKVSDEFLTPLFEKFFQQLGQSNLMQKSNFHVLVNFIPTDQIDPEIKEVLDRIVKVARRAKRRLEEE